MHESSHSHPPRKAPLPPAPVTLRWMTRLTLSPGCWEWRATTPHKGYGRSGYKLGERRVQVLVHVAVYHLVYGPAPAGLSVQTWSHV